MHIIYICRSYPPWSFTERLSVRKQMHCSTPLANPTSHSCKEKLLLFCIHFCLSLFFHSTGMGESPKSMRLGFILSSIHSVAGGTTMSATCMFTSNVSSGKVTSRLVSFCRSTDKFSPFTAEAKATICWTINPWGNGVSSSPSTKTIHLVTGWENSAWQLTQQMFSGGDGYRVRSF